MLGHRTGKVGKAHKHFMENEGKEQENTLSVLN